MVFMDHNHQFPDFLGNRRNAQSYQYLFISDRNFYRLYGIRLQ